MSTTESGSMSPVLKVQAVGDSAFAESSAIASLISTLYIVSGRRSMSGSNVADIRSGATVTTPDTASPFSRVKLSVVTVAASSGSLNSTTIERSTATANSPWWGEVDVTSGDVTSSPQVMGIAISTIHGPPKLAV